MVGKSMKMMTLGFSTVGKTYFLGSLFKLSYETGLQGFSLQHQNFQELGVFEDVYSTMTERKIGAVFSTAGLKTARMSLKRGIKSILDIDITDIEGQALQPQKNIDIAESIVENISDVDGLILLVKAPSDLAQIDDAKMQLMQMLNFASRVLEENKGIPISIVLSRIDELPELQGVKAQIDEVDRELKKSLKDKFQGDRKAISQTLRLKRGEAINPFIKEAIDRSEFNDVLEQFFIWMETSNYQIPNKIFPCTSLGFDNAKINDADSDTLIATLGRIAPYGTAAAFLWTVYARLKTQGGGANIRGIFGGDSLAESLLEDIRELYTSGKAYFDNDTPLWSLRNISNLYAHKL